MKAQIDMQGKIARTSEEVRVLVSSFKTNGRKIVFTNGCFDILHAGHVMYLQEAAKYADYLIVGLNSDSSVRRLKGKTRPINDEKSRAIVLAALGVVDMVIIFEEDTPLGLIEQILPDVLVKGGDWAVNEIVGSSVVIENGGEVMSLSFAEGYSTTNIINKINSQ